jgi:RNA polymerase sigma-70 factor (ECF subfamily)
MSREAMWDQVRMAWAMLAGRAAHEVESGRDREIAPLPEGDEPPLERAGFAEQALPWLDAVYRFALRLEHGDRDAAEDLAQETFLRAHRFWHTFEPGSNAKSWLFTICRNTYLHTKQKVSNVRERATGDIDARADTLWAAASFEKYGRPDREFFDQLIDDEVVQAIDGLPEDFREVLVLSDLGDLKYGEIAEVLGIPVGTVKSRLFRGRRILQDQLREFAVRSGYVQEETQ